MTSHTHYWVHVAATNWLGRAVTVCRCACGAELTPAQITKLRSLAIRGAKIAGVTA